MSHKSLTATAQLSFFSVNTLTGGSSYQSFNLSQSKYIIRAQV
nr:MAG TPA: hypothetical protein [Caudoviricetes sp.]